MVDTEVKAARKLAGNDAFRAGDYAKAVVEYTAAIEADDQDYVLFSNRAASYSKLKESKKALADSEECIRLNRTWPKGYARKAAALYDSGSFKVAMEMYTKAGEYEEDEAKKAAYEKDVQRCKRQHDKNKTSPTDLLYLALHLAVVILGLLSVIPLGFSVSAFYWCMKLSMVISLISVFMTLGRPKMNADYAREVMCHSDANRFFSAGVFHLARPFVLGAAPQVVQSAMWLAHWAKRRLPALQPALWSMGEQKIVYLTSHSLQATELIGTFEVITGVMLVIELLTPNRNMIVLFLHWQLLRMRYMLQVLNPHPYATKETITAFASVRQRLDVLFFGAYCPAVVGRLYTKVVGFMASFVDPHAQKAQEEKMSSMLPKRCTVM